jgi:hypothetical protein
MSNDGGVNSISKCPVSIDPLPSQAGVPLLDWLSRTSEERACVVAVASLVASALSQETAQPCAACRPRSQLVASLAALELLTLSARDRSCCALLRSNCCHEVALDQPHLLYALLRVPSVSLTLVAVETLSP